MLKTHRWTAASILAVALLTLSGCGGSSHKADPPATSTAPHSLPIDSAAKPEPGGPARAGEVAIWVGHTPIYKSEIAKRLAIELQAESPAQRFMPKPPAFTECITRLAALAKSSGAAPTSAQLKDSCRTRYQALLEQTIGPVIASTRIIDEAAEEGLNLTDADARTRLEHLKATQFGTEAKFQAFLAQSHETVQDLLFNIKGQLAYTAVFNQVRKSIGPITPATVASYYDAHKKQYAVAERRNLGLIHTIHRAEAVRARKELESGASFAAVVKKYKSHQPIFSKAGLLSGLEPHAYSEPALNDAIFTAKPHVLSALVHLNTHPGVHFHNPNDIRNVDGYYVFEITKIAPAYQKPLAQVKAELTHELPNILYKEAVRVFAQQYRSKWLPRTNCRPGYVVPKCRQFHPAPGEQPEDPYTLN